MIPERLGGNMVMAPLPAEQEQMPEPISFYWYVSEEDFNEEGNLQFTLSAGRLRHKWVPTTKTAAQIFIREHEDAEGLRARKEKLRIVRVFSYDIDDLSDKYDAKMVKGLSGMVVKTPIEVLLPRGTRGLTEPPYYTSGRNDYYSPMEVSEVGAVQTQIMSDEDVLAMSVMEVLSPSAYQDDSRNTPIVDGVADLRMGSNDKNENCETCGLNRLETDATNSCQGHFGHVELEEPIPKILYMGIEKSRGRPGYPLLFTLNHVCHSCYHVLLPKEILAEARPYLEQQFEVGKRNYQGYENLKSILNTRFSRFWEKGIRKDCPHCEEYTPKIEFTHAPFPEFFIRKTNATERYQGGATSFDFSYIRNILANIPDDQARILGFDPENSRPENMFYGILPVAPNPIRPKRQVPGKALDLDDLTKLYQDVVYANNALRSARLKDYAQTSIRKNLNRLYLAVTRVTDNQLQKIGSGGTSMERTFQGGEKKVSYKGIMNRFTGKKGRFRTNLQSKYVQEVGYSTVAPNGDLAIDEVGVPIQMCMATAIEEKVTLDNMGRLKQAILNGPEVYPGAIDIILDGNTYNKDPSNWRDLRESTLETREYVADKLEVGSVVKRHIIRNDIGLFNRAPSLHRQSIMALRAVPLKQKNLSFNATICDPFNADFDGDAMKIHFVQKIDAITEAKSRMALAKNIIHARYGKLALANDQDQVSGIYLLSHTDKRRKGEWNPITGLGFSQEGLPYVSREVALEVFSRTYSQDRKDGSNRWVTSLPPSDITAPDGSKCFSGRSLFSHLFTVLDCEYVSAKFPGNTPMVDDDGNIIRNEKGKPVKETVIIEDGKLIQGTLEKNAIGAGGGSIAPAFYYHEGYEKGQEKLVEFIEMSTRLGLMAHRAIGFTMGLADVKGNDVSQAKVDEMFAKAADKIEEIQAAFEAGNISMYAKGDHDKLVYADQDPIGFMEEVVYEVTQDFEKATLGPIQDFQGSGNAMQISVRSKARGKDSNVQQMGGSYGLVMVGGRRIRNGINPDRVLPTYPKNSNRPEYMGFIKSSYSSGMEPDEYFLTSIGGRRSSVESGMGNISKSGYLERKMIKGIESYIVDKDRRLVNTRTKRVLSPIVGDDGLRPFHIRLHSANGHLLELQPLYYDFKCKHDVYLANDCEQCAASSDIGAFIDEVEDIMKGQRIPLPKPVIEAIATKLGMREVTKPNVRKIAKKVTAFFVDSLCPPGEAVGAVAAACMGEPATQAALRTFHFAGKASFQGSIDRLVEILESPLKTGTGTKNPQSIIRFREGIDETTARKVADSMRTVFAERIIRLVEYDLDSDSLVVNFDWSKIGLYRVSADTILNRFNKLLKKMDAILVTDTLNDGGVLVINANSAGDPKKHLFIKEALNATVVNGMANDEFEIYFKQPTDDPENMGRYWLDIRYCGNTFLNYCDELLGDYIDIDMCNTTNIGWIYKRYGLEAALASLVEQIDFQMNGDSKVDGVGEYDYRYIRTIADIMGEEGIMGKLGPYGIAALANPSILAGCSLERQWPQISHGSIMGNYDPLRGVAESIAVGKTIRVGNQISNDP